MTRYFPMLAAAILLLANSFFFPPEAKGETVITGTVIHIADGDTISVTVCGNFAVKIRLLWCDAPEHNQAYGPESAAHLSQMILGREVELHITGIDKYGRTLAVVMLDGVDINLEQVKSGWAWVFERYIGEAPASVQANYRQAETQAREQRRGLWVDPAPLAPWEFRHHDFPSH
jgi:endonuclease YncB( thermonuclease family)